MHSVIICNNTIIQQNVSILLFQNLKGHTIQMCLPENASPTKQTFQKQEYRYVRDFIQCKMKRYVPWKCLPLKKLYLQIITFKCLKCYIKNISHIKDPPPTFIKAFIKMYKLRFRVLRLHQKWNMNMFVVSSQI